MITPELAPPPPDDIPAIVERYIGLVGKVVAEMEKKTSFKSQDINAVASIGRAVAMLQAVEEARISRVGGKAVRELTTAQLKRLVGAGAQENDGENSDS